MLFCWLNICKIGLGTDKAQLGQVLITFIASKDPCHYLMMIVFRNFAWLHPSHAWACKQLIGTTGTNVDKDITVTRFSGLIYNCFVMLCFLPYSCPKIWHQVSWGKLLQKVYSYTLYILQTNVISKRKGEEPYKIKEILTFTGEMMENESCVPVFKLVYT